MSVDTPARPKAGTSPTPAPAQGRRYRAVWRWHFYAGLIVAPVLVLLAATGSLYLFKDPYENWRYKDLRSVSASGTAQPLSTQIDAAKATRPGRALKSVIPAGRPDRSTRVILAGTESGPFAQGVSVYVNPYTGKVLGEVDDSATLMRKIRTLHGELMVGPIGDRVVETSACWALVLAGSGVYLWWRGPARKRVKNRAGRPLLRRVHALTGVWAGVVIVFLIISGLPWSGVWGDGLKKVSAKIGSTPPEGEQYERSSTPPAKAGDLSQDPDTKVPWAAEEQPVPSSGHAQHGGTSGSTVGAIPVEQALRAVAARAPHCPPASCDYKVLLPKGERGVYTITVGSVANPADERTMHVDQYSGAVIGSYGWKEYGTLAKAVEQGISLHEGRRYGPANIAVMLAACLALITLTVTGVWMWWKRRPRGSVGAPRRPADRRTTLGVAAIMLVAGLLFPLAGITMLAALLIDVAIVQRVPALSRRFG
ncbi:PepSY-associated TM helix domain-containing protein [Actinomadura sp. 6N118]|uniref:PepSY-associated TM helix domain-containing protein n=1 Tax=Actinomadura sp. 6N118 TaxID=3375151 RepID=UPI003791FBC4